MCWSISRSAADFAQHRLLCISSPASLSGLTSISVCLPSVLTEVLPLISPLSANRKSGPTAQSRRLGCPAGAAPTRGRTVGRAVRAQAPAWRPLPARGGPGSARRRRRRCKLAGAGLRLAPSLPPLPPPARLLPGSPTSPAGSLSAPAAVSPRPRSTEQPGRRGRRISKLSPEPAPVSRSRARPGRGPGRERERDRGGVAGLRAGQAGVWASPGNLAEDREPAGVGWARLGDLGTRVAWGGFRSAPRSMAPSRVLSFGPSAPTRGHLWLPPGGPGCAPRAPASGLRCGEGSPQLP